MIASEQGSSHYVEVRQGYNTSQLKSWSVSLQLYGKYTSEMGNNPTKNFWNMLKSYSVYLHVSL